MGGGARPRICRTPRPLIAHSTDSIVDCCFCDTILFCAGAFKGFSRSAMTVWKEIRLSSLSFLMSCCTGLYFHGVVCEELNAYFMQWKRDLTSRLLLLVNCSSALPWIYLQGAIQFAGAKRWRSSSRDPCFRERL
ncbi:hypothetical protein TcCL_Unassigned01633 [Trypanosoma cruzi]|nr:hypothetical protein TcCL_Unassigned01633 [Trypanosoma cruzi]